MKKIVVLLVIVLVVYACKKDDPTRTELLTKGAWTQTAEKYNPSVPFEDTVSNKIVYVADYFDFLSDCAKDDILSFQSNGLYKWETGPTDCNSNGQSVTTASTVYDQGNWVFNSTETQLTLTSSIYNYAAQYDISELTDNKLTLTTSFIIDTTGTVYTQTNEYER
jgi:hypothetical protein